MDDALLDFSPGENGLNRLGDLLEAVDREDKNVLHPSGLSIFWHTVGMQGVVCFRRIDFSFSL